VNELIAVLAILVAIAILFEIARRLGVPYPSLFVIGGLALGFVPGMPRIELQPDLVLLVFLPPLLFGAALQSPIRDLRANRAPLLRLSVGLVVFTTAAVALVAHAAIGGLDWPAAFALGAIVAPTDALAATTVFRRLGAPRIVVTLVEGEALFNDATALVIYRVAVAAVLGGTFVLAAALQDFIVAAVGAVGLGLVVGWLGAELLRRLDDPPVEVVILLVIPFAAYVPADQLGLSAVLAAVAAGLVVGSRLGTILSPNSRVLWQGNAKMVGFVLNGFLFVLIGLALPAILGGLAGDDPLRVTGLAALIVGVVIVSRLVWVFASSRLPNSPRAAVARTDPVLADRIVFVVPWSGLRGAVSLAAALALPIGFPERDLILLLTFVVIVATLVGQGLTLPWLIRRLDWDGIELDGTDEPTLARTTAYQAGLEEIEREREVWPGHLELIDRLASGLQDRTRHLATTDATETAERRQERVEHEQIQRAVIAAQRTAVIELRDGGEINDETLRVVERELDLEELRMEG